MRQRRGLSLIELIFTIVIIAIIFTVIPKVILSLSKSDNFSIRQDALFNAVSLTQMISKLPWDENNTNSTDILHTQSVNFACDSLTKRRIGGFVGSRECKDDLHASAISSDGQSDYLYFNDFDDFNDANISASYYGLNMSVNYIDDNITYNGQKAVFTLKATPKTITTNLKMLDINVSYQGRRGKVKQLSGFNYISSNLGAVILNKRVWK